MTPLRITEAQTRVFVAPGAFRSAVASHKAPTGGRCSLHFPFPEHGLELALPSDRSLTPLHSNVTETLCTGMPVAAAGGEGGTFLMRLGATPAAISAWITASAR